MRPAAAAPLLLTAGVFVAACLALLPGAACLTPPRRLPPLQGMAAAGEEAEEKVRLGSSPPSCRGKCYECSPCTPVQVPAALSAAPSGPAAAAAAAAARRRPRAVRVRPLANSEYKPVGWKCQCGDRRYEP
ncbi:hypothetical protein ACP4OV_017864 [Aristida adscensionis]